MGAAIGAAVGLGVDGLSQLTDDTPGLDLGRLMIAAGSGAATGFLGVPKLPGAALGIGRLVGMSSIGVLNGYLTAECRVAYGPADVLFDALAPLGGSVFGRTLGQAARSASPAARYLRNGIQTLSRAPGYVADGFRHSSLVVGGMEEALFRQYRATQSLVGALTGSLLSGL